MESRKLKGLSAERADAAADIALINQHSMRELTPDEVFCFSLVLCDNDTDRDFEFFSDETLDGLAELFVGKPVITDHRWSAEKQVGRIYRASVEETGEKNGRGTPMKRLVGSAYMLKTEQTQPMIDAIEGGIIREVSVGCQIKEKICSICGERMEMNWECKNGHQKGMRYEETVCCCELSGAVDAFEVSFVAVPAQKGAGVTKELSRPDEAFELLLTVDLSGCEDQIRKLMPRLRQALQGAEEREARAKILAENKKFLKKE